MFVILQCICLSTTVQNTSTCPEKKGSTYLQVKHQFIAIAFIAQRYISPYFFLKSPSGTDICIKTSIQFHIYWFYNQWTVYWFHMWNQITLIILYVLLHRVSRLDYMTIPIQSLIDFWYYQISD